MSLRDDALDVSHQIVRAVLVQTLPDGLVDGGAGEAADVRAGEVGERKVYAEPPGWLSRSSAGAALPVGPPTWAAA